MAEILQAELQLGIQAFTQGLNQAIQATQAFVAQIQQQMNQAAQALSRMTQAQQAATTTLQQQAAAARQATQTTQTQTQATTQATQGTQQFTHATQQATQATQHTTQAAQQATQTMQQLGHTSQTLGGFLQGWTQTFQQAGTQLLSFEGIMRRVFTIAAGMLIRDAVREIMRFGEGIVSFVRTSVSDFATFEAGILKTGTMLQNFTRGAQFEQLATAAHDFSIRFGRDMEDVNKALFQLVSIFGDLPKAMTVLEGSGKLAVAGFTDMTSATRATQAVIKAFNLDVSETPRVANALFVAARQGREDVLAYSRALSATLPSMAAFRVSMQEAGAAIAVLTPLGFTTSEAVHSLNRAIEGIGAPTIRAAKWMEALGIEFKRDKDGVVDLYATFKQFEGMSPELLRRLFGGSEQAFRGVLTWLNHMDQLKEKITEAQNAGQDLDKAYQLVSDSLQQQFKQIVAAVAAFKDELGKAIAESPAFKAFLSDIQALFAELRQILEQNKEAIQDVTTMLVALGQAALWVIRQFLTIADTIAHAFERAKHAAVDSINWIKEKAGFVWKLAFPGESTAPLPGPGATPAPAPGGPVVAPPGGAITKTRKDVEDMMKGLKEAQKDIDDFKKHIDALIHVRPLKDIDADIAELQNRLAQAQLPGEFLAIANALEKVQQEREALMDPTQALRVKELEAMGKAFGDEEKDIQAAKKAADDYTQALNKLKEWADVGGDKLQHRILQIEDEMKKLAEQASIPFSDLRVQTALQSRLQSEVFGPMEEAQRQSLEKQQRQAEEAYNQMAESIQRPFESIFASILNGQKNLLDTLKSMFFRWVAETAARALTQAIIIPVLFGIVGGGSSGGGLLGAAGSLLGGGSSGGSPGGQEGGSNIFGQALGILQQGFSIYRTGSSLLGGSSGGYGSLFGGITSTELFSFGGGFGSTGAAASLEGLSGETGTFVSGTAVTVGTLLEAAGAGIAVGFIMDKINHLLGLHGAASGALAGAAGGAVAGTIIWPGIGTAVGTILGAALGALFGGLFEKATPKFDVKEVQAGRVAYSETLGLQKTQEMQLIIAESSGGLAKHHGEDLRKALNEQMGKVVDNILAPFQGLSPQLQQRLVDPLNSAFEGLADMVKKWAHFEGDTIQKDMEHFFGTTLQKGAEMFFGPLLKMAQKIDPLIKGFNQVIATLSKDLKELEQAQKALHESLQTQISNIQNIGQGPGLAFQKLLDQFHAAVAEFETLKPGEQINAAAKIQQMADNLIRMITSPDLFGFDPNKVSSIQKQINDLIASGNYDPRRLQALQDELASAQNEQSAYNAEIAQYQNEIVAILKHIDEVTQAGFEKLKAAVQEQIDKAKGQIDLLLGLVPQGSNLVDMDAVDKTVQSSTKILDNLNAMLSKSPDTSALMQAQTILLEAQVAIAAQQLQVLTEMSSALGGGHGTPAPATTTSATPSSQPTSYQFGTLYVPRTGWAFLHQGEQVVPAWAQRGGDSGPITIHIHGADTKSAPVIAEEVGRELERRGRLRTTHMATRTRY